MSKKVPEADSIPVGYPRCGKCGHHHSPEDACMPELLKSYEAYEKAKEAWKDYWERPGVAEGFGGKEPNEQNPKFIREEKPISDLIPQCDTVLDAGCGAGRYLPLLKNKAKLIVAVDYSPSMLKEAKKKHSYPNVHFEQGDLEHIKVFDLFKKAGTLSPPKKFDVTLCVGIIRHLPTKKGLAILRNLKDTCKILFLAVPIFPEGKELPMPLVGYPDKKILDHPYHISDIKEALGVEEVEALGIGDRQATEGKRYLLKVQLDKSFQPKPVEKIEKEPAPRKTKPKNRLSYFIRELKGEEKR